MSEINISPVEWLGNQLRILDQTLLPHEEVYLEFTDYRDVASAIKKLRVRGAPAIGVAGAYAVALGALNLETSSPDDFKKQLNAIINEIAATRPTARNLFFALERMRQAAESKGNVQAVKAALVAEAKKVHREEVDATDKLSKLGAALLKDGDTILTHCNAGPLATTGYGTALGIIIRAHRQGKQVKVFVDETRPLLQGARLTTWELKRAGVPFTLITDNMAGYMMSRGRVSCVITGADRIAANGDTANKIGTYTLAVLAKEHNIPFYIAAPTSTIDVNIPTGADIPIEERGAEEVTCIRGVRISPDCAVANPAFDVTPHRYITAIITERGVAKPPFGDGIIKLK